MLSDSIYILVLISLLGNNSFRTREFATNKLQELDRKSLPYLNLAIQQNKDIEVKTRCRRIRSSICWSHYNAIRPICEKLMEKDYISKVSDFHIEKADKLLNGYEIVPWLDSLNRYFFEDGYSLILKYVNKASSHNSNFHYNSKNPFPNYKEGTRLFVIDLIASGAKENDVRLILNDMVQRSKGWDGRTMPLPDLSEEDLCFDFFGNTVICQEKTKK